MCEQPRIVMTWYVVYQSPRDFPGEFVIRRHFTLEGGTGCVEEQIFCQSPDLQIVRSHLPDGLKNLGRFREDDPAIYEVWV